MILAGHIKFQQSHIPVIPRGAGDTPNLNDPVVEIPLIERVVSADLLEVRPAVGVMRRGPRPVEGGQQQRR